MWSVKQLAYWSNTWVLQIITPPVDAQMFSALVSGQRMTGCTHTCLHAQHCTKWLYLEWSSTAGMIYTLKVRRASQPILKRDCRECLSKPFIYFFSQFPFNAWQAASRPNIDKVCFCPLLEAQGILSCFLSECAPDVHISFVHNHVGSQYTLIHHSQVSYSCVHAPRARRVTLTSLQCCFLVCGITIESSM